MADGRSPARLAARHAADDGQVALSADEHGVRRGAALLRHDAAQLSQVLVPVVGRLGREDDVILLDREAVIHLRPRAMRIRMRSASLGRARAVGDTRLGALACKQRKLDTGACACCDS